MTLLLLNKPFGVLCQFSPDGSGKSTLKDWINVPGVYPAGRLDATSEGLLALTDDGALQARLADPKHKLAKVYWAQLEGEITELALRQLQQGVLLKDGLTLPAEASVLEPPGIWPRDPPIRFRTNSPTSWLRLTLREGKNRQVRRMTAAVGFPTLRLIRAAIGPFELDDLAPGAWREAPASALAALNLANNDARSQVNPSPRKRSRQNSQRHTRTRTAAEGSDWTHPGRKSLRPHSTRRSSRGGR